MTDEPLDPTKEEAEAWGRFALMADGKLAHRYLRRVLEGVIVTPDSGALRDHNGRRTLARDIMRLMASGIEANRDRTSEPDESILAGQRQPVAVGRPGSGRRVQLEPGDGWKSDDADE